MKSKPIIVCRCEEITREEIIEAIKNGARSLDSIKKMTRAGMGICQGASCSHTILRILAEELKCGLSDLAPYHSRVPVRPVYMGALKHGDSAH